MEQFHHNRFFIFAEVHCLMFLIRIAARTIAEMSTVDEGNFLIAPRCLGGRKPETTTLSQFVGGYDLKHARLLGHDGALIGHCICHN